MYACVYVSVYVQIISFASLEIGPNAYCTIGVINVYIYHLNQFYSMFMFVIFLHDSIRFYVSLSLSPSLLLRVYVCKSNLCSFIGLWLQNHNKIVTYKLEKVTTMLARHCSIPLSIIYEYHMPSPQWASALHCLLFSVVCFSLFLLFSFICTIHQSFRGKQNEGS